MKILILSFLIIAGCTRGPVAPTVVAGKHWVQGCIAQLTASGSLVYTQVTVVGITPQGTYYWVAYPQRLPRVIENKAYAEKLPIADFIPRGSNGHANNGRPTRCPEQLWVSPPDTSDIGN